jgi:gluconolactonase
VKRAALVSLLAGSMTATGAEIERYDARLDGIFARDAVVERLADGFRWVEGPVWSPAGFLLFSDIPANRVYRLTPGGGVSVVLERSGYSGTSPFTGREPGSNGLAVDGEGRLVLCEHGDRRITRIETNGSRSVLIDRFEGRRLNSPNDVVIDSKGDLYFTDPPFGLPRQFDDPARELGFSGVYRLTRDGDVQLLTDALRAPNGIALSPDERTLYVSDVDPARAAWLAFPIEAGGGLGAGRVLLDLTAVSGPGRGAPDGIEVDAQGHLYGAGPGGVYVLDINGNVLGKVELGVPTANVAWGEDGTVLYVAANTAIYRIATRTRGASYRSGGNGHESVDDDDARHLPRPVRVRGRADAGRGAQADGAAAALAGAAAWL